MQEYALIYAKPVMGASSKGSVLFVLKNRPVWQAGRLNLPGGKIEPNETPAEAAVRELKEETGYQPIVDCIEVMGQIQGPWGIVHCVKIPVNDNLPIQPDPEETEIFAWLDWVEVRNHKILIPNLRTIIPLMMTGVTGWSIEDAGPTFKEKHHTISITLPCDNSEKEV